jgi:hypothetical protein
MKSRRIRFCACLLILLIFAAACGDGREEPKGQEKTVSKAEFVRQGNQICRESMEDFNQLFETDFPVIPSQVPAFFQKAAPIFEKQISDLRDLGTPEGDQDEVREILEAGDKAAADFEAATRDERRAVELFSAEGGQNEADFEEKAKAYGLTECTEEGEEEEAQKLDPSTFPPEKRAYVERADAICRRADERTDPIEDEVFRTFPPTLEAWANGIPRLMQIDRPALQELRQLDPPSADRARVDAMWEKRSNLFNTADQAAQAARARDESRSIELLQQVFQGFEETDQELRSYGFQVCGSEDVEGPGESPSPGTVTPGGMTTPTGTASPTTTATPVG